MFSNCQVDLLRACQTLKIKIVVPYEFELNGISVEAQALLPQIGGIRGHLIFNDSDTYTGMLDKIRKDGYTASYYRNPSKLVEFDVDTWISTFSDWGWNSDDPKPDWFLDD